MEIARELAQNCVTVTEAVQALTATQKEAIQPLLDEAIEASMLHSASPVEAAIRSIIMDMIVVDHNNIGPTTDEGRVVSEVAPAAKRVQWRQRDTVGALHRRLGCQLLTHHVRVLQRRRQVQQRV